VLSSWLGIAADELRRLEDGGVIVQATGEGLKLPPEVLGQG
jgi:hypothetical protein